MDNQLLDKEKKTYVSLYKKNGLPYSLTLLATLAELIYVVMVLDVMAVSYKMGFTVMINILVLFMLFACAMNVNVYHRGWSLTAVALGVYMLVRMAVIVPVVLKPYDRQLLLSAANLIGGAILIAAGFISVKRTDSRQKLQDKIDQSNAG